MGSSAKPLSKLLLISLSLLAACSSAPQAARVASGNGVNNGSAGNPVGEPEGVEGMPEGAEEETTALGSLWPVQIGGREGDEGSDVAVDVEGNVFVVGWTTGELDADGLIVKFDPKGKELWRRQFDVAGADYPDAALVDEQGNLYVAGQTINEPIGNLFLQKYSRDGVPLWSRLLPGGGEGGFGGMTRANGSIFIVGRNAEDIAVRRVRQTDGFFDPASDLFEFAGSSESDAVSAITADRNGDLYIAGFTNGAFPWYAGGFYQGVGLANFDGEFDGFVMKLDVDFNILETMVLPARRETIIQGAAVNAAGEIFVTGYTASPDLSNYSNAGLADGEERFLAKFVPPGPNTFFYSRQWVRQSGASAHDFGFHVAIGPDGSVWVTGTENGGSNSDIVVSKHEAAGGSTLFSRSIGSGRHELPNGAALSPAGEIFVTGTTAGILGDIDRDPAATDRDLVVIGLDSNGDLL